MRILLLNHLGLGDFIQMNGLVHTLIENLQDLPLIEICLVAVDNISKPSLLHLYSDYPIVTFHWMDGTKPMTDDPVFQQVDSQPPGTVINLNNKLYISYTFGLHAPLVHWQHWIKVGLFNLSWVDSLYLVPLAIHPQNRYTKFHLPSDCSKGLQKYEALIERLQTKDYILIHDDPSRNRNINKDVVSRILRQDNMENLPILYLGKNRYNYPLLEGFNNVNLSDILVCDSIFDLVFILKFAKALHLMDSSIACLVDVLNIQSKMYMHSYMMYNTGKSFQRPPWVRIEGEADNLRTQ